MQLLTERSKIVLEELNRVLVTTIRSNLRKKGHNTTGRLSQSIEVKVRSMGQGVIFNVLGEDYGRFQEEGQRRGGRLRNIAALTKWVQQKGLASEFKKAQGIAFAIAKTHQKIGMHTVNGRIDLSKRGFISESITEKDALIGNILFRTFEVNFDLLVSNFSQEVERTIEIKL